MRTIHTKHLTYVVLSSKGKQSNDNFQQYSTTRRLVVSRVLQAYEVRGTTTAKMNRSHFKYFEELSCNILLQHYVDYI